MSHFNLWYFLLVHFGSQFCYILYTSAWIIAMSTFVYSCIYWYTHSTIKNTTTYLHWRRRHETMMCLQSKCNGHIVCSNNNTIPTFRSSRNFLHHYYIVHLFRSQSFNLMTFSFLVIEITMLNHANYRFTNLRILQHLRRIAMHKIQQLIHYTTIVFLDILQHAHVL